MGHHLIVRNQQQIWNEGVTLLHKGVEWNYVWRSEALLCVGGQEGDRVKMVGDGDMVHLKGRAYV